jgi:hypothetical protein
LFDAAYEKGYKEGKDITRDEKRRLLKWFLIASFNGIYSSSSNSKIESDLVIVRDNPKSFPLEELLSAMRNRPPRQDKISRSDVIDGYSNVLRGRTGQGYLMLLSILLHNDKATNWAGKSVKPESAAIHHIFPREFLRDNGETREDMVNCLANLTYIDPSVNSEIGDTPPDEYLSGYSEDILQQHFIPIDRKLYKIDNFPQFLKARFQLIWKATSALIDSLE